MKEKMLQRAAKGLLILVLLLLATTPVILAQEDTPEPNPYFSVETLTLPDGTLIDKVVINGPPDPPPGFEAERAVAPGAVAAAGTLPVPAFDWAYGCSATSAAMIAGYYDRAEYPNMYTGLGGSPAGVMPMDNDEWGSTAYANCTIPPDSVWECPLSATHSNVDGRGPTLGHVDDYWVGYGCGTPSNPDPFTVGGGWPEHTYGDCTGDYMKTNQDAYGNSDGSTTFYYFNSGAPIYAADLEFYSVHTTDGGYGHKLFYQSRGYTVVNMYNQYRLGYPGTTPGLGFTYDQYKAEIDAGRPVMIHVAGHTMVGVGYDDTITDTMYINDTWDWQSGVHTMIWGDSYSGMAHVGVTIVQLAPMTYVSTQTGSWENSSTWVGSPPAPPGPNSDVTISSGDTVTLIGDSNAMTLTVESGAALDLAGYGLTVGGAVTNNGTMTQTLTVNNATVEFLSIQNVGGSEYKYRGVDITTSGNMGSTTVAIRGNQQCTTQDEPGDTVDRCFDIDPEFSVSANVTFHYLESERQGLANDMAAWHWTGGGWALAGTPGMPTSSGNYHSVPASGVSSYSPFVIKASDTTAPTSVTLQDASTGADLAKLAIVAFPVALSGLGALAWAWRRRRASQG
jgi:hypothetical protein